MPREGPPRLYARGHGIAERSARRSRGAKSEIAAYHRLRARHPLPRSHPARGAFHWRHLWHHAAAGCSLGRAPAGDRSPDRRPRGRVIVAPSSHAESARDAEHADTLRSGPRADRRWCGRCLRASHETPDHREPSLRPRWRIWSFVRGPWRLPCRRKRKPFCNSPARATSRPSALERFRATWTPVRVKKTRPTKTTEQFA